MIKDLQHVLSLRKKKTIPAALNMHTKEVMQLTKILYGELLLES